MQVDWSKAPEGATHWGPQSESYCEAWYEVEGGRIVSYLPADSEPKAMEPADNGEFFYHHIDDLVERPSAWTGEGLPPVGAVCEVDIEGWHICEVIAHFQQRCGMVAAFTIEVSDGAKILDAYGEGSFRPIRTPEQIAAEERAKAIDEMWSVYWQMHAPTAKEALGLLYDAGYRKQP
ncbi:hypothetical protein [Pseudomonas sp.]|uniref:hypothetical protein n=1 Tax=Pseudomonas sp. TaxID=306 RepID=UPI0019E921EE|nr:hypothetical protein [Pseudomonas sp.]MBF0675554.1 hypothetical protein [Pseudomonas sp.]